MVFHWAIRRMLLLKWTISKEIGDVHLEMVGTNDLRIWFVCVPTWELDDFPTNLQALSPPWMHQMDPASMQHCGLGPTWTRMWMQSIDFCWNYRTFTRKSMVRSGALTSQSKDFLKILPWTNLWWAPSQMRHTSLKTPLEWAFSSPVPNRNGILQTNFLEFHKHVQ